MDSSGVEHEQINCKQRTSYNKRPLNIAKILDFVNRMRYNMAMSTPYRVLGHSLLPLIRWRIDEVEGLENLPAGGFILVANHQSWSDSAIAAAAIHRNINKSIRFIAQSSKWRFLGGIPINEYDNGRCWMWLMVT